MVLIEQSYVDDKGITRIVLLPEGETDIQAGIPLSVDLTELYEHMPLAFQRELYEALQAQGLVKVKDFFAPGAYKHFQAALLSVIKHDFLSVQAYLKGVNHNG
jgi:hypothetical protein